MRRRSRHRGAMTLAICIPVVLLIVAAYGLSGGFKSTPGPRPGGASGQAGPKAPPVRPGLNIGVYEPAPTPALKAVRAIRHRHRSAAGPAADLQRVEHPVPERYRLVRLR